MVTVAKTVHAGPETPTSRSSRSHFAPWVAIPVVVLLGLIAVANTTIVLSAILLVVALTLLNSRPMTWIVLAIVVPWTSRLLTAAGTAPRFLDFLDFPQVLIAFLMAGIGHLNSGRRLEVPHVRIGRRLLLVTLAIVLSWAFHDLDEPQRLIAGWVLAVEPFLLLMAILVAPLTAQEHRKIVKVVAVLLCGQLAFSIPQILTGGVSDHIKGTLLAAGAGHHVSAGGLAIGFFLIARLPVPRIAVICYGATALLVSVIADAKQVLFALPVALLVLGISGRRRQTSFSLIGSVIADLVMTAESIYGVVSYRASWTAFDFLDCSGTDGTGKVAVASALWNDVCGSFANFMFGFGPGETVSRFSFLTTPDLLKEGSPVTLLGLHASRGADHYDAIAFSGPFTGESSFTSAQSSALGILGDYGIAGVLTFAALMVAVVGALRRNEDRRLRSTALAAWAMLIPLSVVFDWLEQPPFTLAVMLVTGLALRGPRTLTSLSWRVDRGLVSA